MTTLDEIPIARTTDPRASYEGAAHITQSGKRASQCELLLAAIVGQPGMTTGELAHRVGLDQHKAGKRLSDLKNRGDITRGEERRCSVDGTTQGTWWPVKGENE